MDASSDLLPQSKHRQWEVIWLHGVCLDHVWDIFFQYDWNLDQIRTILLFHVNNRISMRSGFSLIAVWSKHLWPNNRVRQEEVVWLAKTTQSPSLKQPALFAMNAGIIHWVLLFLKPLNNQKKKKRGMTHCTILPSDFLLWSVAKNTAWSRGGSCVALPGWRWADSVCLHPSGVLPSMMRTCSWWLRCLVGLRACPVGPRISFRMFTFSATGVVYAVRATCWFLTRRRRRATSSGDDSATLTAYQSEIAEI